ncbi:hypothetical protein NB640_10805 [Oxalobacter vibrioformis]|uniref:Uncharacterized protein n=1 Tax=Oxalobacter vibrioformis TaxID=933080 RepID=A0A9E9P369_9BURK|nr:hypothetical protein [Oxalobacter vibrioformis]WAW09703.1 hypothetical protein NB640_10805 [Oxalobacter vibrioformis]
MLCSCISLYEQNYQNHGVEIEAKEHREPSLVVSENYEADGQTFVGNGMVLMGESVADEYSHGINRDEILEFAKKIGASYVLVEKHYDHTESRMRTYPEKERIVTRGPHGEKVTTTVTKEVQRRYDDTVYRVRTGCFIEKSHVRSEKGPFSSHRTPPEIIFSENRKYASYT